MNNQVWSNHLYSIDERIECNLLFNITEQLSADEFKGTLQVQSRRPVYNTNYSTVMFNYMDNDIHFRYVEFEPLEFDQTQYLSSLTSLLINTLLSGISITGIIGLDWMFWIQKS